MGIIPPYCISAGFCRWKGHDPGIVSILPSTSPSLKTSNNFTGVTDMDVSVFAVRIPDPGHALSAFMSIFLSPVSKT
jgi:hypothetical protein